MHRHQTTGVAFQSLNNGIQIYQNCLRTLGKFVYVQTKSSQINKFVVIQYLSIPMVYRDGQMVHSQCEMYSRNYTEIVMLLHSMDTITLLNKGEFYLEPVDYTARNYEIIKCKDGWMYDRNMFPNTVVMEV